MVSTIYLTNNSFDCSTIGRGVTIYPGTIHSLSTTIPYANIMYWAETIQNTIPFTRLELGGVDVATEGLNIALKIFDVSITGAAYDITPDTVCASHFFIAGSTTQVNTLSNGFTPSSFIVGSTLARRFEIYWGVGIEDPYPTVVVATFQTSFQVWTNSVSSASSIYWVVEKDRVEYGGLTTWLFYLVFGKNRDLKIVGEWT